MSKAIGIAGWADGDMFGVNKKYLAFAQRYGTPRIILPTDEEVLDIDLLILPGGPDIPYNTYSDIPDYNLSKQCPFRDHFERIMLPKYLAADVPTFGICRGMQVLTVMRDFKLLPHISVDHPKTNRTNRSEKVHKLEISEMLRLQLVAYGMSDEDIKKIKVNSLHHQGVVVDNINKWFAENNVYPLAYSGVKHKYLEVIASGDSKFSAVAYHPEELDNDPISDMLIKRLLNVSD